METFWQLRTVAAIPAVVVVGTAAEVGVCGPVWAPVDQLPVESRAKIR
jgi:hypothetical protein